MLTQNEYFLFFCRVNKIGPLFTRYITIYVLTYLYISPNCHHPRYNPFYGDISYQITPHPLPSAPHTKIETTPVTIQSQLFIHVLLLLKTTSRQLKTHADNATLIHHRLPRKVQMTATFVFISIP